MEDKKLLEITNRIYIIRDQKVMLDRDLAELYGVEVSAINQAVKRNKDRFPDDFCFQLNSNELAEIKSQSVIRNYINTRKGESMNDFRIEKPFETRPPRLKDLVNEHVMGDVWIRDTPFGPVTDSLKIAEHFDMKHKHILRSLNKCSKELSIEPKFGLNQNFIENSYLGGAKGKKRKTRKVDITEFGLMLLLLYINTQKARMISAEILYRFFILKSYIAGLSDNQIDALKGYYRKRMKD